MRKYKTVKKMTEYTDLVEVACDLCGRVGKWGNWGSSMYDVNEVEVEVTVRHKDGTSFPEGGSGEETVIDLCPVCFTERLIPWLQSQGAKIETKEWEW